MSSVSIIIPAWNEETSLEPTLEALLQTDYDKEKCEVIVVAGGDDNTERIAFGMSRPMEIFSRYAVIPQRPQGKNAAIQEGMKAARNDIIVLIDADTMVSRACLRTMLEPIEEGRCDLALANPEPLRKTWVTDFYMIRKVFAFRPHRSAIFGNFDWGICPGQQAIAFKADSIKSEEKYFFETDIKVGVDYLLCKRFVERGRKVMNIQGATVTTYLPSSLRNFLRTELRWLTALVNIDGVNWQELMSSTIVVGALVSSLVAISPTVFILAMLFNTIFIAKKGYMFVVGSKRYVTRCTNIFGFIVLSYAYHILRFISYVRHFFGRSEQSHLFQGER